MWQLPYWKRPGDRTSIKDCYFINVFVWQRGISPVLSPFNIVEDIRLDFHKHFHVIFEEHLNTFDDSDNTMRERTVSAMALGPSKNM